MIDLRIRVEADDDNGLSHSVCPLSTQAKVSVNAFVDMAQFTGYLTLSFHKDTTCLSFIDSSFQTKSNKVTSKTRA